MADTNGEELHVSIFRCSREINELTKALVQFQGEYVAPEPDSDMTYTHGQASRTHRYRSMDLILKSIRPALKSSGLAITQVPAMVGPQFVLVTKIMHTSGQWEESCYPLAANATPHARGSEITYAKRYSLDGMLAIGGMTEIPDDDGGAAQEEAGRRGDTHQSPPPAQSAPRTQTQQARTQADPAADSPAPRPVSATTWEIVATVKAIGEKSGVRKDGKTKWVLYIVETVEYADYSTFDGGLAQLARAARQNGKPLAIEYSEKSDGRYTNRSIVSMREADTQAAPAAASTPRDTPQADDGVKIDATVTGIEGPKVAGNQMWFKVTSSEWGDFYTCDAKIASIISLALKSEKEKGDAAGDLKISFWFSENADGKRIISALDDSIPF